MPVVVPESVGLSQYYGSTERVRQRLEETVFMSTDQCIEDVRNAIPNDSDVPVDKAPHSLEQSSSELTIGCEKCTVYIVMPKWYRCDNAR